jgi:hypothetical protein
MSNDSCTPIRGRQKVLFSEFRVREPSAFGCDDKYPVTISTHLSVTSHLTGCARASLGRSCND